MSKDWTKEEYNVPLSISLRRMEWALVYINLYHGLRDPLPSKQDFEEAREVLTHLEKLLILHSVFTTEEIQDIHNKIPLQWTKKQPAEKP